MTEEKIDKEEHEKVKEYLHEEILKRDKEIERLKDENRMLLATSVKRNKELKDLQDQVGNFIKK
ncbi:hypothetical protein C0585_05765 [Candidatus Woesearchaeota archaeon]|nr:MAG: hypothetical protein C0585_05765 [Candidatus Woesearchaeota archaeon]